MEGNTYVLKRKSRKGLSLLLTFIMMVLMVSVGMKQQKVIAASVPIMPGLAGYGTDTPAGRGPGGQTPTVYKVTNLNATGAGSLQAAIESAASGPSYIIFEVSGQIDITSLNEGIALRGQYITIAGQTAPAPGITIKGGPLDIRAKDVLIQHIRFRPGDDPYGMRTDNRDCLDIWGMSESTSDNIVIDHCTFNWSMDELVETSSYVEDVTFNKCIFSEPLYDSYHMEEHAANPFPSEFEGLSTAVSSGDNQSDVTNSLASGGYLNVANLNAVGDYVQYTVNIETAGTYKISPSVLTGPDKGKYKLYIDGTLQGTEQDLYSAAPKLAWNNLGSKTFSTTGNKTFKFEITGKNSSSSDYDLGFDYLAFALPHAMGPYFMEEANAKVSVIGSLFSNNDWRGSMVLTGAYVHVNNLHYNRGNRFIELHNNTITTNNTIEGNIFIEGPSKTTADKVIEIGDGWLPASKLYVADNYSPDYAINTQWDLVNSTIPAASKAGARPVWPAGLTAKPHGQVQSWVLANAGARPANRDSIENRIIGEVTGNTGSLKNSVASAGGWPVYQQNTRALTLPANPFADTNEGGYTANNTYTNIEEWLFGYSAQVEGGTPTPTPTATSTPTPSPTPTPAGGSLSGVVDTSAATVNLTTTGTADWAHWYGYDHKATGGSKISNYSIMGSGSALNYTDDPRTLTWSDGTPAASGSNRNGIYISGISKGFTFTAPADTTQRELKVFVGGWASGGTLTAHLSDGSAADYVNTVSTQTGQYDRTFTLTYKAASAGKTLNVSWVQASGTGNVTLSGAALNVVGATPTPAPKIEAESAVLAGEAYIGTDSYASNGSYVYGFYTNGSVQFNNVPASTQLKIGYSRGTSGDGQMSLYINGVHNQNVTFPATSGWTGQGAWSEKVVSVSIPEGATVRLQRDSDDYTIIQIDYISR